MDESSDQERNNSSYGGRPLWQWVIIYLIIGAIVYGLIYYFVIAKRGGYSMPGSSSPPSTQNPY